MGTQPASSLAVSVAVNGEQIEEEVPARRLLVHFLRDDLGLTGTHVGCDTGNCGACTVHLNGDAVRSCVTPVSAAVGGAVTTLEGLGTVEKPHPLQQAFLEEQAVQCGYCINGIIMTAAALLTKNPRATESQIRSALAGNLCRCGTHMRILRAVRRVARA